MNTNTKERIDEMNTNNQSRVQEFSSVIGSHYDNLHGKMENVRDHFLKMTHFHLSENVFFYLIIIIIIWIMIITIGAYRQSSVLNWNPL